MDQDAPAVDPADQWVLDPATGEFRLDLDATPPPVPRPRMPEATPVAAPPTGGRADRRRQTNGGKATSRGGKAKPRGRKRALKWAAGVAALVLVAGCGGAYYAYQHFNGNLSSVDVKLGDEAERPVAAAGAMNILVIGTDSREGLGRQYGDAGSPGHADTTLLFHISKDRSNSTVLSIPRDLMVPIPECETAAGKKIPGSSRDMFNNSLGQNGRDAGCTWKTVEKMTGIRIDHFVMVDFEAVKTLSTAVGGVEVCAAKDINDKDSHLKMSKGKHVVQGDEALAFVRTRHAVGQGGDLTRIPLQQQFISSMIRKMKSGDTLTSPTKLWNLADAATKALTVDSAIKSADKLKDLALDLAKVNTENITFITVPVLDDPKDDNRLVLKEKDASQVFAMIAGDKSLTKVAEAPAAETPAASPSPSPVASSPAPSAPAIDAAAVKATVRNGSGVSGLAGKAATTLQGKGFVKAAAGNNATATETSSISYPRGQAAQAAALAVALGLPAEVAKESSTLGTKDALQVVLGADFAKLGQPAPPVPTEAPKDLQRVQADDTNVCAK